MKTRPLVLDRLEPRDVPAGLAPAPHDFQHLTLSFANDGTHFQQYTSQLFNALKGQKLSQAAWQTEILRAIQTWAQYANINVGLVKETGHVDLGALPTGNATTGDIRVAGVSMASGQGPVGDVVVNTACNFGSGSGPQYDLETVLLHEFGHVFGLDDSTDASSIMYEDYAGPRGLGGIDIAALRARFGGARAADAFDAAGGNDTAATATKLDPARGAVEADITTAGDVDFYKFSAPTTGNTKVTIRVQSAGLSLLVPQVTVYDSAGHVVASAEADGPLDNDLDVQLKLDRGATYYVKVGGATKDAFGIGSYRLSAEIKSASGGGVTSALADLADPTAAAAATAEPGTFFTFPTRPGVSQIVLRLNVTETQILRLDLSATGGQGGGMLTLLDASGKAIAVLNAGAPARVLLGPGVYSFRLDPGGADAAKVTYTLGVRQISDPIDAYPVDPTLNPVKGKTKGAVTTTTDTPTTWLPVSNGLTVDPTTQVVGPWCPGT
jgi:hypothetical protein